MSSSAVVLPFVASFLLSVLAVFGALVFARSRAVIDVPNERSAHSTPTPRGGGLGIVCSIAVCIAAAAAMGGGASALPAMFAAVIACGVGFADDRKAMRPLPKMTLLVLAAATALPLATVRSVDLPFVGTLELGLLAVPLSLFWLACFSNAFNFMDGLNGISGLTALVSGLGFAVAGLLVGDDRTAFLGAVTAGAAAGFLPWNFPKAKIFMGDAGSLPLGMLLAVVAVGAAVPAAPGRAAAVPFPAAILLLGPYVFDVTFTLIRRAREGKRLGEGHSEHLYQRLSRGLGGHVPATLVFAGLSVATASLALVYSHVGETARLLSLILPPLALLASAPLVFSLERRALARRRSAEEEAARGSG